MESTDKLRETQPMGYYLKRKPTIWERLGFGTCTSPRHDYPELDEAPAFAPGWVVVEVYTGLDWKDRLRVFVSGKLFTSLAMKTDRIIGRSQTFTKVSVLPPNHPMKRG